MLYGSSILPTYCGNSVSLKRATFAIGEVENSVVIKREEIRTRVPPGYVLMGEDDGACSLRISARDDLDEMLPLRTINTEIEDMRKLRITDNPPPRLELHISFPQESSYLRLKARLRCFKAKLENIDKSQNALHDFMKAYWEELILGIADDFPSHYRKAAVFKNLRYQHSPRLRKVAECISIAK